MCVLVINELSDESCLDFTRTNLHSFLTCISPLLSFRMVDDLHRLVKAADIATPFILIGSELGTLNGRFYSHIHDT